jgi:hypothetical protein
VVFDVRVRDDGHQHALARREHAAQAIGLVGRGRVATTGGHVSDYVRAGLGAIGRKAAFRRGVQTRSV